MKKNANDDELITRRILREVLKDYPTRKDVWEIAETVVTKSELRTDERARQYRDEILNRLDKVMGELAQGREDRVFIDHEIKGLKDKSVGHEERIKNLETKSSKAN